MRYIALYISLLCVPCVLVKRQWITMRDLTSVKNHVTADCNISIYIVLRGFAEWHSNISGFFAWVSRLKYRTLPGIMHTNVIDVVNKSITVYYNNYFESIITMLQSKLSYSQRNAIKNEKIQPYANNIELLPHCWGAWKTAAIESISSWYMRRFKHTRCVSPLLTASLDICDSGCNWSHILICCHKSRCHWSQPLAHIKRAKKIKWTFRL